MTKDIKKTFDDLEWHDALLLSMNIDRQQPGERDEVTLLVVWSDERKSKVRFRESYALDAQMNFGVVAPESIRAARCIAESPRLVEMRERWRSLGVDLADLCCFEITTNSTASVIRIFARDFNVTDS